jgi:hypothetical protein
MPYPSDMPPPPIVLAKRIADSLAEVGFSLHRCEPDNTRHGLGGICLLTVEATPGQNPAGIVVSWTPHCLLLVDEHRRKPFFTALQTFNSGLGSVLKAFGYETEPFRSTSAWIVKAAPLSSLAARAATDWRPTRPASTARLQADRTPCRPTPEPRARCRTTARLH